jgi:2-dehydro-3-deoxy-D-arabinonate dehydratase
LKVAQVRNGSQVDLIVDVDDSGSAWNVTDGLSALGASGLAGAITAARTKRVPVVRLLADLAGSSRRPATLDVARGTVAQDGAESSVATPVDAPEAWAAGVTYRRSREARLAESVGANDFYARVYEADRPEIFLKDNNGRRTVGAGQAIGVRGDSASTVPEPEFALVVDASATIVGITLANDVTARDIEGENPLYLPQAKIFTGACALGPAVTLFDSETDHNTLFDINLAVTSSDGEVRYEGACSTRDLNRTFPELVGYLARYNLIADGTVLMTGTGIVPPAEFRLRHGDRVVISSTQLGVLANPVVDVLTSGELASSEVGAESAMEQSA